jgi:NAD+ kinase
VNTLRPDFTVLAVVHHERPDAVRLARRAHDRLVLAGYRLILPPDDAHTIGLDALAADPADHEIDLVLSLGGDGTVLRAVALVAERCVPILAVNVGQLGYLTEIEPDDFDAALTDVLHGDHRIEERMLLSIELRPNTVDATSYVALNEVVLERIEPGHTVRILPSINDVAFTPYAADGLIIATPTGSTAYALSARGPILSPRLRALLMTPVSPHMLFDRSMVLHEDDVVGLLVDGHRHAAVSIDGRSAGRLAPGEQLAVRAAPQPARFVRLGHNNFHQRLKAKFGLSDR